MPTLKGVCPCKNEKKGAEGVDLFNPCFLGAEGVLN